MDGKEFIIAAESNAIVIDALHRALYAMALVNGCAIDQAGVSGTLHFEYEIGILRRALFLLGIDTSQPLPAPSRRK